MQERAIDYHLEGTRMCGVAFVPDNPKGKLPGVLVAHDWRGRHPFSVDQARSIAEKGYVALAIDMYGDATIGKSLQENVALSTPFYKDRALMMARVNAALAALKSIPEGR